MENKTSFHRSIIKLKKTIDKNECLLYYSFKTKQMFKGDTKMINTLHIKNIGIIDEISIDLNDGLNILTGETGAGKTLIIDSLLILAGGRFSKEMIRRGQESSFIELCLFLPNHPDSIEGNIIISREVSINGRNLCRINGRMVTVNELKNFMQSIIEIHGQHDNQTLLDISTHLELLDAFSGGMLEKELYKELYGKYQDLKKILKENFGDDKEKQRKLDLLKYQFKEIEDAKLKEGEDDDLEEKKQKILNLQKISDNIQATTNFINDVAIDAISSAIKSMEKIEEFDTKYSKSLINLKNVYYELQEAGREINEYSDDATYDYDINEIEERLDTIFMLKRKYGNTIDEIQKYQTEIKNEIEKIENMDEFVLKTKMEMQELEEKMLEYGRKIHNERCKKALILEDSVNNELKELEMKNAHFKVQINYDEKEFKMAGFDSVEFMICTNVGEEEKPLIKISSGGEMSRIMLAIKTVLADVDKVPVLVFDEIDTGISGTAANSVAEKLEKISMNHQVICVTHLASIAAKGKYNYYIEKNVVDGTTKAEIKKLSEEETIKEIARIASGVITEIAIAHAKEMRKKTFLKVY